MSAQKPQEIGGHQNLSIRLPAPEFERYKEVLRRGLTRNPLADKTKIIRELLGLESYGLLKDRDIAYFRGQPAIQSQDGLGDEEQKIVRKLAKEENRSFEEQVRELVLEALLNRGEVSDRVEQSDVVYMADYLPKPVKLKLLGEIAAGEPLDIFTREETIEVPNYKLKPGKNYYVLRVRGNSMADEKIFDGSFIICEAAETAKKGDRIIAMIDGEKATVKKYYPESKQGRIRLQPANELHKPIYVTPDRLKIQGIVIGTWRP